MYLKTSSLILREIFSQQLRIFSPSFYYEERWREKHSIRSILKLSSTALSVGLGGGCRGWEGKKSDHQRFEVLLVFEET